MRNSKFPKELVVHIENAGKKDDEYFSAAPAITDDPDRYSDGQKVAVYAFVGIKTVKKTCGLE